MKILEAETLSNICADPEGLGCRRPVGQFRSDSVLRGGNSQLFAASLTIVHVYEPVSLCEYASETSNTVLEEQRDDLQKMLKQLTRKLQTSSLICTSAFLVGAPAEQISALAREIDADLIVTASHHPTFRGRLSHMDKARLIMHPALCPVLIYHQKNWPRADLCHRNSGIVRDSEPPEMGRMKPK